MIQNEAIRQLLGDPDFDPGILRKKYLYERNKRIRSDGNSYIAGRDGHLLSEKWKPGIRTLHGMQTNGFPNTSPTS